VYPALPLILIPIIIIGLYATSMNANINKWRGWENQFVTGGFILLNFFQIIDILGSTQARTPKKMTELYAGFQFFTEFIVVFNGKPGTGKTHLGCAMAIAVARLGDTALFATATEFTRAIRETYNGGKHTEAQTIERYAAPQLLVLDEVGASSGSDHEKQQLFELINRRYSESRPTLLLTNLSVEEVQAYLGERILDRLRDGGGKLLRLDWESHRK
jgi:DNA replication protein DnaC